jgi:general secretion pathway protein C
MLYEIEPWAIVVDRAGKLERISLEQGKKLATISKPVQALADNPAVAPAKVIKQQMNRAHVQQQLGDLPALLSQARVVPNYTNGKPDGFLISEIVSGSLYQQAGLQNGDVILMVNGKRVTSTGQAMSIYRELQDATAIDLELMRAGQVKQVHYDIR